jgi:putative FmdB family regulatory protein
MPIYAYRCSNCGHAQDALQKLSDPVLTVCPACGQPTYVKQVTAAGFQLKGSGWYVTDFRGDGKPGKAAESGDGDKAPDKGAEKPAEAKAADSASKSDVKNGAKPAESAAAPPAPAPAAASPAPVAPAPGPSGKTSG